MFVGGCDWGKGMEENTSKAYIQPANALLSSPRGTANGAGSPLFVINLCASMAPVQLAGKSLPGLDSYRLYQVSRVEDGRTRYRLRLGFFISQQAADAVLATVRKDYATAFTACLSDEDRRFTRGYVPDTATAARPRPVAVVAQTPPPPAVAKQTTPVAARAPAPTAPTLAKQTAPAVQSKPALSSSPATTSIKSAAAPAPSAKQTTPAVQSKPAPSSSPAAATAKSAAPVIPAKPAPAREAASVAAPAKVKPADVKKIEVQAADTGDLIDDLEIELTWETESPLSVSAPPHAQAPGAKSPKSPDQSDINEIEMSWARPSLPTALAGMPAKAAASAASASAATNAVRTPVAPKTIPAGLKAEPAIKSKPAEKTPPAAKAVPELKNPPVAVKASAPVKLELESTGIFAAASKHQAPAPAAQARPFHVGKGIDIPKVNLSLQQEAAAAVAKPTKPAAAAVAAKQAAEKPVQQKAVTPAARAAEPSKKETNPKEPAASASKAAPASQGAPQPRVNTPPAPSLQTRPAAGPLPPRIAALPDLDSTQTIRALTNAELKDDVQEKWFAIQLAISEQPVNLDAMPHLDIFEAYRLYSVASAGSGKIVHSLRLGFFREAVSAEAVSGYLKTFFPTPSVLRISAAEQLRFKDAPPQKAPAAAETKNDSKVIDLNHARDRAAKPTTLTIPTVTMEVAPQQSDDDGDRSPTGAYRLGALSAAASRKSGATGTYKMLNPTLKPAAKSAGPATKRSVSVKPNAASQSGRYKSPSKKSLQDQLLDEAREVELSESGIRRLPKNDSLLSRLVDKLKK
jgi:hypothetical protein